MKAYLIEFIDCFKSVAAVILLTNLLRGSLTTLFVTVLCAVMAAITMYVRSNDSQ